MTKLEDCMITDDPSCKEYEEWAIVGYSVSEGTIDTEYMTEWEDIKTLVDFYLQDKTCRVQLVRRQVKIFNVEVV